MTTLLANFAHLVYRIDFFTDILPPGLQPSTSLANGSTGKLAGCRTPVVFGLIQNGLVILFVVVIILAIVYSAIAGLKYIRSEGEADKVEEAQKALKSVVFGVAAVFIGIIGVIIITSIFSTTSAANIKQALASFVDANSKIDCSAF